MPTQLNRGSPGILAIPGRKYVAPQRNLDGGMENSSKPLIRQRASGVNTTLTGTTVNSVLAFIPFCIVDLFLSDSTNAFVRRTTSDASGNFTFVGPGVGPFFIRAVDASGTPVGTTLNGLTAS